MSNSTPDKAVKKMKDLGHIYTGLFKKGNPIKLDKFIKQWRERKCQ